MLHEITLSSWKVGQAVRVRGADQTIARRGIISLVHSPPTSFDIIYENSLRNVNITAARGDEEERVDATRMSALLDFESQHSIDISSASTLKSNANTLFGLRDYQSALVFYMKAMERLVGGIPLQVGCLVLVSYLDSADLRTGMIADSDDSMYDVLLDADGRSHSEEEVVVAADRVLVLAASPPDRVLQRSLYLNMARCASKLSLKGWTVKYASIALAISSFMNLENPEAACTTASSDIYPSDSNADSEVDAVGLLADCLYFRGRSLLTACRPQMARKVMNDCQLLLPPPSKISYCSSYPILLLRTASD